MQAAGLPRPLVRGERTVPAVIGGRDKRKPSPQQRSAGFRQYLAPAVLLLALFLGYFQLSTWRAVSNATPQLVTLGLGVAHTNSGLKLSWDPSAKALRGVSESELVITDGTQSRLLLSPTQILRGRLWYTPLTNDVRFNMRWRSGDRVAYETAVALDSPISRPLAATQPSILKGAVIFPSDSSEIQ